MRISILPLFILLLLPLTAFSQEAMTYQQAPLDIKTHNGTVHFTVEIAETPKQHEYGLMYRTSIPDRHGMIFTFSEPQFATFWMKNTLVPLDMIFITNNGVISQIVQNAPVQSIDRIPSDAKVRAVIETLGGTTAKYHIAAGDRVKYPLFP